MGMKIRNNFTEILYSENVFALLDAIISESELKNDPFLRQRVNNVSTVMYSRLFVRCYDLLKTLKSPRCLDELKEMLTQTHIRFSPNGLPPLTGDHLYARLGQLDLPEGTEFYSIELPENEVRRSGLILREQIANGAVKGLFVTGVERKTPASQLKDLQSGDQLVAVAGFPLDWRTLGQIRHGLVDCAQVRGLPSNANLYDLAKHLLDEPYRVDREQKSLKTLAKPIITLARLPQSQLAEDDQQACEYERVDEYNEGGAKQCTLNPECEYVETVLNVDPEAGDLGIQLERNDERGGVFVASIRPNSQAALDGILRVGDRVVEANYGEVGSMAPKEALKRIKSNCKDCPAVQLKCVRPTKNRHPDREKIFADPFGDQRNDTSAQEKYSYQLQYWKRNLSPDVEILFAEYEKNSQGLGISVESTKEQEVYGNDESGRQSEAQSHHYIVEVEPDGPIGKQNIFQVGDELLEVNDNVLLGSDHMTVARVLHDLPSRGFVICARDTTPRRKEVSAEHNTQSSSSEIQNDEEYRLSQITNDSREGIKLPFTSIVLRQRQENSSEPFGTSGSSDVDNYSQASKEITVHIRNASSLGNVRSSDVPKERITVSDYENIKTPESETCSQPVHEYQNVYYEVATCKNVHSGGSTVQTWSSEGKLATGEHGRLPMPSRVAVLQGQLKGTNKCQKSSVSSGEHERRTERIKELTSKLKVSYDPTEHCYCLNLMKSAGELLGLELDSENGGPNGILLIGITSGTPLDLLVSQYRVCSSRPSERQSDMLTEEWRTQNAHVYVPSVGDWIVSVAGYDFRGRESFRARRLLRRLVAVSASVE
ncbi:unnamed protein product [Calicophoron daubneyi]|uniref:PDZ domain-containing protein n=1 Tax=Calicophoron daubneyi TaxID=300641 RepID=A0AAV2TNI2_CALDB